MSSVLFLIACSSDSTREQQSAGLLPEDAVPVALSYRMAPSAETRAAALINLNQDHIEIGKSVAVLIRNHGVGDYTSYNYTTAEDGALDLPNPAPYYPTDGTTHIDILAYYPASAGSAFTVQTDQSTNDGYAASDLMWATPITDAEMTTSPRTLTFTHLLSKVIVHATAGAGISKITSIALKQIKPRVSFNNTDGFVGDAQVDATTSDVVSIDMVKENVTSEVSGAAVIPAQTVTGNLLEITVEKEGGSSGTATYSVPSGKTFSAGHFYTLDITVSYPEVGATTNINDWTDGGDLVISGGGDFTFSDVADQTYTGSALTPAVTVSYRGAELTSSDYDKYYYSNQNAGTAYIVVLGKGATYSGKSGVKTFTINKADPSYTAPTAKTNLTYTGSAQALLNAASNVSSGCTVSYKLGDGSWQSTVPTAINANTSGYTVYWKITGNNNYNDVVQQTISGITIAKATPTCTAPTKKTNLTYNGSPQELVNAASGVPTGCTVSYKLGNDDWQTTVPKATDANTSGYTVYWKITGNNNYNDGSQQTISGITIAKGSSSMSNGSGAVGFTSSDAVNKTISRTISCTNCSVSGYTTSGSGFSVSRDGNTITVKRTSANAFSGTITVTGSASNSNYNNPTTIDISVSGVGQAVALSSSSVGYKVGSDGKAYPANASLPSGVSVIGMVAYKNGSNGIVLYKENTASASRYDIGSKMPSAVNVYVSDLSNTTSKSWTYGSKTQYENCGVTTTDMDTLKSRLSDAGCTNTFPYACWSSTSFDSNGSWLFYSDGSWSADRNENTYPAARPLFAF